MFDLSRRVRFCVNGVDDPDGPVSGSNTFAAAPPMRGIGAHYELTVRCTGEPDPVTGLIVDIKVIDAAVRKVAVPLIRRAARERPGQFPGLVLRELSGCLEDRLEQQVTEIAWHLGPYYCVSIRPTAMNRVSISQRFEFAAAHRLHCDGLSEAENRDLFGKCNSANGHGHNYQIEVCASTELGDPPRFTLEGLERVVSEQVIRRFDHRHLNLDTDEFAARNPSVENIAGVCYRLLAGPIESAGGELEHVTVWETEKTSCTYPARSASR